MFICSEKTEIKLIYLRIYEIITNEINYKKSFFEGNLEMKFIIIHNNKKICSGRPVIKYS